MLPRSFRLQTARLILRPSGAADADRGFEIQSNWNVTRNLRNALFPPDRADIATWFAGHAKEWEDGTAYRFAIVHHRMVGLIDIYGIADGECHLGYWLDESAWGGGFASEAGQAVARFAFDEINLAALNAGHAADNLASGRVLAKLGFHHTGDRTVPSRSRGTVIVERCYRLERQAHAGL